MSASSGQRVELRTPLRECTAENDEGQECSYYGFIEAWFDPELSTTEMTWDCPRCGATHTESAS